MHDAAQRCTNMAGAAAVFDKSHVHAGCARWPAEYQSQPELHSRIVSAAAANKACV